MGVKTTINLRSFHTDYFYLRGLPLVDHHIWMKAWHPEMEDIDYFLRIMVMSKCAGNLPVFVHCMSGKDRTGAVIASYRVRVMGWSKEEAINEMLDEKFGSHYIWGNLLENFIKNL